MSNRSVNGSDLPSISNRSDPEPPPSSEMRPWGRFLQRVGLAYLPPVVRRTVVAVVGGTILLIGLLLMVLPGPGVLVILVGLAVLGSEFVWARRLIQRARELGKHGYDYVKSATQKS